VRFLVVSPFVPKIGYQQRSAPACVSRTNGNVCLLGECRGLLLRALNKILQR